MIDEEQIRAVATDAAYKRGVRYFRRGAVGHLERQEDRWQQLPGAALPALLHCRPPREVQ